MVEMVINGSYKSENGFKPGYLTYLEQILKVACLASNIKARPHIESRLKSLKKDWQVVNDIMNGTKHGCSGFGFDLVSNMVTVPDDVWDAYIASFPDAKQWRSKSFPHYASCNVIFGADRATGDTSIDPSDAVDGYANEGDSNSNNDDDQLPNEDVARTCGSSRSRSDTNDVTSTPRKRRKKLLPETIIQEGMVKAAQIVAEEIAKAAVEISKATAGISKAITLNQDTRSRVVEALDLIEGMTEVDKFTYGPKIMSRPELMTAFLALKPESHLPWMLKMFPNP